MATYTKTWHWNCASSLCTNNYRTKGITYYTLPSDPELQKGYRKVLMNENINWRKHVICSAHWSSGKRENKNQLPDIICTKEYAANLEKEYSQKPCRELKRKIDCTKTVLTPSNANTVRSTPRKPPKDRSETPVPRVKKRRVSAANVEKENQKLKSQVESLTRELNEKKALIEDLQQQLSKTQTELEKNAANNSQQLNAMKKALEGQTFSYEALMRYPDRIYYMTGLSLSELDCLYECLEPFLHAIVYPDCNNDDSSHLRKLDTKTELISFLTICRHALDLGVIAWMTGSSISTMSRIFVGWCVLLSTIFESIDLTPLPGFLNDYMPKCFLESGYGDTALIGDATEIWISQSENFDINNITFSNYKNHTTGKICLWTLPPGFLLKCTDAFPGSISDADITEQSCVLDTVTKGKTVMTDKGFNITDICHEKGLLHNRPPMKFSHQFDETEVVKNFDIATLRIYIENYIGRIRDWQILSKTWPSSRIDLLGCCFQIFAHIVNMLKKTSWTKIKQLQLVPKKLC